MKKMLVAVMLIVVGVVFAACSSEPKLVVSNAYKHKGDYQGSYYNNAYTFQIKNDSRKDIESVDYFRIYVYDGSGNQVYVWNASKAELQTLALKAGESGTKQLLIPENRLPYNGSWSYDTEYRLNYYD